MKCFLPFGQFGLKLLHVREQGSILGFDSIDFLLQLIFPNGHCLEVCDLAFELGGNVPLSAWFWSCELADNLLDLRW